MSKSLLEPQEVVEFDEDKFNKNVEENTFVVEAEKGVDPE